MGANRGSTVFGGCKLLVSELLVHQSLICGSEEHRTDRLYGEMWARVLHMFISSKWLSKFLKAKSV